MQELTARLDALEQSIELTDEAVSSIAETHEERLLADSSHRTATQRAIDELRWELQDFKSEMYAEIDKLRAEAKQAARRW